MPKPSSVLKSFAVVFGLLTAATTAQSDLAWRTYSDPAGSTVQYPAAIFPQERIDPELGRVFTTADRRAQLRIYSDTNSRGDSPAAFLARLLKDQRSRLTYNRVTSNFFAISARDRGLVLYRRCNFVAGHIHCIDVRYPQTEKRAWDLIVSRLSLSLRPR